MPMPPGLPPGLLLEVLRNFSDILRQFGGALTRGQILIFLFLLLLLLLLFFFFLELSTCMDGLSVGHAAHFLQTFCGAAHHSDEQLHHLSRCAYDLMNQV
jgi:hypothetical protein